MPQLINVGTPGAQQAADDLVSFSVRTGDTVVLKNHANSTHTFDYYTAGHGGGATGNVVANASASFTTPGTHYLTSRGRSTVQISGGIYGQ